MTTPTSPYRTEIDALHERKASLEGDLARLREQASALDALRAEENKLAAELASIESRLRPVGDGEGTRRKLPMLDDVRVASPCNASWDEMIGDERVRFCGSCQKNVFNLSSMAREEAEALLAARLGNETCVRFYRRADGTMLTADCPVGQKKKRRKLALLAVAGAGAMAAAAFATFQKTTCRPMQGAVATMGELPSQGQMVAEMGDVAPTPPVMGTAAAPQVAPPIGTEIREPSVIKEPAKKPPVIRDPARRGPATR